MRGAEQPAINGIRHWHRFINHFQTALLVVLLIGISALAGSLIFGEIGLWIALGTSIFALILGPSWLRTHPATEARIARLLEMLPPQQAVLRSVPNYFTPGPLVISCSPRWYPGGYRR